MSAAGRKRAGKPCSRWQRRDEMESSIYHRMGDFRKFMDRVMPEPNSGCWLWTGALTTAGYGQFPGRGAAFRSRLAPRISYQLFRGPIPSGACVLHTCDVRCCVNPDHLWLGTHLDNQQDKCRKGRHPNQKKTHCIHGHEYTPENTKIDSMGWRKCRICIRARYRRRVEAAKKDTPITVLNT